jgi:hypothetical protein
METPPYTGTVLDQILEARLLEVEHRKKVLPETALKYGVKAATPLRDFSAAISKPGINILAELKPASPSRGVIRDPFDPVALATSFEAAGAAALPFSPKASSSAVRSKIFATHAKAFSCPFFARTLFSIRGRSGKLAPMTPTVFS